MIFSSCAKFTFLGVGFSPVIRKSSFLFTLLKIFPELFSIKDLASDLLIPTSLPVIKKLLLNNLPLMIADTTIVVFLLIQLITKMYYDKKQREIIL